MKSTIFYLLIISFLFSCAEKNTTDKPATQKQDNFAARIDSFLTQLDSEQTFMGSVSLTQKGKEIYSRAIGYRDLENGLEANSDTRYRIASITKTFTAVLVFTAIEEKKLQLYQTIDHFFPKLKNGNKISIAHLLHHQSGIQSFTKDDYFWEHRTENQSTEELLNAIHNLESLFEPGEDTQYSNSNYFLLTQMLERIFEDSYENLLEKYIISPLQLKSTLPGKKIHPEENECLSYTFEEGKWELFPETHLSLAKGTGSLVSTPRDLNIFFRSLLTGELVTEGSLDKMKTIVRNHGMGLFGYSLHDQSGHGHGGNIDGFTAQAIYFPVADIALSITSNASAIPLNEVYAKVLELFLGQPKFEIAESELEKYAGVYISQKDPNDKSVFEISGDTLVHVIMGEFRTPLIYKGNRRFLFTQLHGPSISFSFSEDGKQMMFEQAAYKANYRKE